MMIRLPMRIVSVYWRLTRGATLGAQGVVIDGDQRILLVRHGYRGGWHFPGGGIEWGETAETALARELEEEAGVVITGPPQFHGLFANFRVLPSDHVALFVVREWERPSIPAPNHEIRESRFFSRDGLPPDVAHGTECRLAEILDGVSLSPYW